MSTGTLSLEVTYRKGRAIAAYLYLPREENDHTVRTERREAGLIVDFADDNRPIGVEITSPQLLTLSTLNDVLNSVGQPPATSDDLRPLQPGA
jgi:hypothetical protein